MPKWATNTNLPRHNHTILAVIKLNLVNVLFDGHSFKSAGTELLLLQSDDALLLDYSLFPGWLHLQPLDKVILLKIRCISRHLVLRIGNCVYLLRSEQDQLKLLVGVGETHQHLQ